jgi:hypothetical protein
MMVLIDSNVILDIWDRDPVWNVWSTSQLRALSQHEFAINPSFTLKFRPGSAPRQCLIKGLVN